MCIVSGSIEQAINVCPMCKVFPQSKCPHVREVCHNRISHPTFDVLYLKNAEVNSFNGCGYCKYAQLYPPNKQINHVNPGWPGCCRPPNSAEARFVQAADWRAVSIVHHVPIPPEIKSMLDSLSKRGSPLPGPPTSRGANGNRSGFSTFDRRGSNASITNRPGSSSAKSPAASSSSRGRSGTGGSPKPPHQAPVTNLLRSSSSTAIPSSLPTSLPMDQHHRDRRYDHDRQRSESSSRASPSRKQSELEGVLKHQSHSRRPSVTPATTSVSVSKVVVDGRTRSDTQPSSKRRSSVSNSNIVLNPRGSSSQSRPSSRPTSFMARPIVKEDDDSSSTSGSSSSGSESTGSLSDSTVTSDGAFTDYLSDESEAELQRQAEARAALVALNMAEELEFKAVRQQLAHVDLHPPKVWNPMHLPVKPKMTA